MIQISIIALVLIWAAYLHFKNKYKEKSKDFLKLKIAKENNWLYSPQKDKNLQKDLAQIAPDIFRRGNTMKKWVEDQYFGKFKVKNKEIPFHFGNFYYEIESGSGENKKTIPYRKHFFAFKLNKLINNKFLVRHENFSSKIGNIITKKDIDLESIEFNKNFVFNYRTNKQEVQREILKIFKPSLQLKFLELKKKKNKVEVLFDNDCIIFLFNGFLIKNFKTDITKELRIKQEDVNELNNQIDFLKQMMTEIMESVN